MVLFTTEGEERIHKNVLGSPPSIYWQLHDNTIPSDFAKTGKGLETSACGTVGLNLQGIPKQIKCLSPMSKEEVQSVTKKGLLSLKWMDQ